MDSPQAGPTGHAVPRSLQRRRRTRDREAGQRGLSAAACVPSLMKRVRKEGYLSPPAKRGTCGGEHTTSASAPISPSAKQRTTSLNKSLPSASNCLPRHTNTSLLLSNTAFLSRSPTRLREADVVFTQAASPSHTPRPWTQLVADLRSEVCDLRSRPPSHACPTGASITSIKTPSGFCKLQAASS